MKVIELDLTQLEGKCGSAITLLADYLTRIKTENIIIKVKSNQKVLPLELLKVIVESNELKLVVENQKESEYLVTIMK